MTRTVRTGVAALAGTAGIAAVLAGTTPAGASPSAATPSAAHARTHVVHVNGVGLRVPASWKYEIGEDLPVGCIVDPAVKAVTTRQSNYGESDCQLQVRVGKQIYRDQTADHFTYYGPGDTAQCVRHGSAEHWRVTASSGSTVDRRHLAYRRFALACLADPAEQWFAGSSTRVLIQRTRVGGSTEAAARRAVRTATLPA